MTIRPKKAIVVIDDNDSKRKALTEYMFEIYPDAVILEFSCLNPALNFITHKELQYICESPEIWLIVTDMQMPRWDNAEIKRDAGFELLKHISHKGVTCDTIIVSSESVDNDIAKECNPNYLGSVMYDSSVCLLPKFEELLKMS